VDMFDCVMPTRNARNGTIFTTRGRMNVRNLKNKFSDEPIDPGLNIYASQAFSLGYLRHLFTVGEILGLQLATMQNLGFYMWLVKEARKHILDNTYSSWKTSILDIIS
ncbi:MAG: tRNA-guanine transglycosylase, partial [Bacteroidota bacterium]